MSENEYIDVSNLVTLRAIMRLLGDVIPVNERIRVAARHVSAEIALIEQRIEVTE